MRYLTYLIVVIAIGLAMAVGLGFYLSPQNQLERADAIVVVSGGETDERVEEGVRLYSEGWADTLIVSGAARDEGISNAIMMKQIAVDLGMPSQNIVVEENAQTTYENAKYVFEIIESEGISSIILVTSPYHQRRVYLNFRKFLGSGYKIINRSARDSAWRKNGWWNSDWARHLTFSELQKIIYSHLLFATKDV